MNKKKRRLREFILICIIIFLLLFLAGGTFFIYTYTRPERKLPGIWIRRESLGNEAYANARAWLDEASLGAGIPLSVINDPYVELRLQINADGSWTQNLNESLYEKQIADSYEAMAQGLRELLIRRAADLGAENITQEQAEEALSTVTGLSTVEYLKQYGPQLLSPKDELLGTYSKSGTYTTDKNRLLLSGETPAVFLAGDTNLLITPETEYAEPLSYRREGSIAKTPVSLENISKSLQPIKAYAAERINLLENLPLQVNGGSSYTIRVLNYGYGNNRYLSIRDVAVALNGTEKQFSVRISNDEVSILTGESYSPVGGENVPFEKTALGPDEEGPLYTAGTLRFNTTTINGETVKYYSMTGRNSAGIQDCFFNITDLAMMLDLDAEFSDNTLLINTTGSFHIDPEQLEADGFFDEVASALVGDATTGEIFISSAADVSFPIASTTKLMTYLLVMDAVSAGEISLSDMAVVSKNGETLSRTSDGIIRIDEGQEISVEQLLFAMMLASSNESALTLAEHVSGSEEAFVERMHTKAALLGIDEGTVFHNSNGLPCFPDNIATSKNQNNMSSKNMFLLVKHILDTYPQIRDITSQKTYYLSELQREVKNTNPLVYNLPECFGLKTGTTNMSGACLVAAMDVTDAQGNVHQIVAVEFGAEDSTVRVDLTQELLLYGKQRVLEGVSSVKEESIPTNAEELIQRALGCL